MTEHDRLAAAAAELVAVICPDFAGDLPAALTAIAGVLAGGFDTGVHEELRTALAEVDR